MPLYTATGPIYADHFYFNDYGQLIGHDAVQVNEWLAEHPSYRGGISHSYGDGGDDTDCTDIFMTEEDERIMNDRGNHWSAEHSPNYTGHNLSGRANPLLVADKWSMTPDGRWICIPFIRLPDGSDKPAIPERIIPKEQTKCPLARL